ncbi:hypothetical protein TanjilG_22973 [Lupinus angustifolius]|uniref:Survival protein SurE-like phosphatase/nucleotidase domain-containing protein n=1 Tax=Lupinus angustifolius TaxID=3871 RepID=A0A1J7HEA4_LUPAN|nr:hypothetical protein TanjilG_22973 [Lupinus angustifolius]
MEEEKKKATILIRNDDGINSDGTVAGAREAFFNDIPSISISYDRPHSAGGKSKLHDFILAAQVCVPIIRAVLVEIKNQSYPPRCFLNINVPNNVANHKGNTNAQCQRQSLIPLPWGLIHDSQGINRDS